MDNEGDDGRRCTDIARRSNIINRVKQKRSFVLKRHLVRHGYPILTQVCWLLVGAIHVPSADDPSWLNMQFCVSLSPIPMEWFPPVYDLLDCNKSNQS